MPKELVHGSPLYAEDGTGEVDLSVVEVRWGRWPESGVQIATRRKDCEVFFSEEDEKVPCEYGFYIDLDRNAINELMRKLRRARDQAFGRDE